MKSSSAASKNREKNRQELLLNVIASILKDEDNKYCADCEGKGPRWASWNLGVFLCIRCAGCHRNLGVHISRVKSVNLDVWTDDQVSIVQQMGNRKAKLIFEALLPENFRRPQTDYALEQFIRAKYEQKRYVDRSLNWEPPKPRPVNFGNELQKETRPARQQPAAGSQTASGLVILPPVPNTQQKQQHQRTPSSSSLSPPLPSGGAKAAAPMFDLFGDDEPVQPKPADAGLAAGVASIRLSQSPPNNNPSVQQQAPTETKASAFDELSFLGGSPQQPNTQQQTQPNLHPQQHQQRSVSNYDLMSVLGSSGSSKQPGESDEGGGSSANGNASSAGVSGGGLDDILSLYKQQPTPGMGAPGVGVANSFSMFPPQGQTVPGHAPHLQHQRNYSDAALPAQMFGTASQQQPQQQPQPQMGFGAFGMGMPMQQQQQQPQQPQQQQMFSQMPLAGPEMLMMKSGGGFSANASMTPLATQQPAMATPPTNSAPPVQAATSTASAGSHRDTAAFDAIWQ